LTAMLHQMQGGERRQVVENLAAFDSLEIRNAFTKLFMTEEGADEDNCLLQ